MIPRLSALLLLTSGCRDFLSQEDPDLVPLPTDPDADPLLPAVFGLTAARFVVDSELGVVGLPPDPVVLEITVGDGTFAQGLTVENSCVVTLSASDPISPLPSTAKAWLSFALSEQDALTSSTCEGREPAEVWGAVPARVAAVTWTVGVGPLSATTATDLASSWDNYEELEPYLVGGGFGFGKPLPGPWADGWVDSAVTFVTEVDEDNQPILEDGDPKLVEAELVPTASGVVPASYDLAGITLLSPFGLLDP